MAQSGIARVLTLFIALVGGMIAGKMLFSRCSPASASSAVGSVHSRPHYVTPKDTETDAPPSKVAPHRVVAVARTPGEPISFREKEAYKVVKGMCAQNADLFPGVLDTSGAEVKWVPESCKLPSLKDLEAEACFSYVNQVWVGDTNLHSLAMALGRRAGSMTTASEKRKHFSDEQRGTGFPKDSFNYFFDFIEPTKASPMAPQFDNGRLYFGWAPSSRKPQTLNYTFSKEAIRSADYVVMSNGLDDMSSMFTPVMEYFHIMRKTVEAVKRSMKPGSRVLLIPVHYFNLQKAKKGSEFALCNSGTKAEAYRQALSLVASCTGSAMLDSYDIMKEAAHFTTDGVHYTDNMMAIQANIVAAYICGGMALPSDPAACATEETVASALLKLSTVYEVNIRCREEDTD